MCLLKVYVENTEGGDRTLIAKNVAYISLDNGVFRILDVDGEEKNISGADFLMIDAVNSTFVLKARREIKVRG
ncbi:MAG: CooT family nickel-binding protein [Candidatus Bathyarchaeia archaeon]|nr:CooT family nickel-binding protein [Candidatus Bathyarchaeota archaeon]